MCKSSGKCGGREFLDLQARVDGNIRWEGNGGKGRGNGWRGSSSGGRGIGDGTGVLRPLFERRLSVVVHFPDTR